MFPLRKTDITLPSMVIVCITQVTELPVSKVKFPSIFMSSGASFMSKH